METLNFNCWKWLVILFWGVLNSLLLFAGEPQKDAFNESFTIQRGTNIAHWLSQSHRRGDARQAWFTRQDVEFLAQLGCDHLRIPIDEEQMWNEEGQPEAEAFQLLNNALDWCADFGLRVIVDLHILRSHHFNVKEKPLWTDSTAQERFLDCWRELSAQLKNRPVGQVAYELMNEAVAEEHEQWNQLIAKAVRVIRENEPNRVLVIGSNRWQIPDTFPYLKIPEKDKNILLSFHFYTPMVLTHYQASWTNVKDYAGPVSYPGQIIAEKDLEGLPEDLVQAIQAHNGEFDRDALAKIIQPALEYAKAHQLPLYCGEWGCLQTVPSPDRLRWYADMRSIFEENNIAWATWNFKSSEFGIQYSSGKPDEGLIEVLFPGKSE